MSKKTTILYRLAYAALFAVVACHASIARAAVNDRGVCGSVPPKSETIAACSRIIASPGTSAHDRAMAYTFRAEAKRRENDFAGAIADYTQALTLLPDYLPAIVGRGVAKHASGDTAGGDADIARAKAINPSLTVSP